MRRLATILCGLWVALAFSAGSAHAQKRVALVIGNGAYQNAPALPTPANDAGAIADLFRKSGFDVVEAKTDLSNIDFKRLIREFANVARDADIAVMYFSGHAVNVKGANYLLPVDVKLASELDAEDEAVSLDRVMRMLEPAKRMRLILLDASRDNPFVRNASKPGAANAGLARFEPENDDTFVVYSAKPGTFSEDGPGDTSAFAAALVKNLAVSGRDLRTAIGFARDDVVKATGGKQEVLLVGSFGKTALALVPEKLASRQIAVLPSSQAPASAVDATTEQRQFYEMAERVGTRAAFDAYLQKFPSGFFSDLARAQRDKLASGAESPAGPKRIAVLPAPGSADRQQAPTANVAVLPPAADPSEPDPDTVTRELQAELQRVGCDPGSVDGNWSQNSRQALEQFNRRAGMKLDTQDASVDALDAVKSQRGRICPLVCGGGQRADGERCVAIPAQPRAQQRKEAVREPAPRARERVRRAEPVREAPPAAPAGRGRARGSGSFRSAGLDRNWRYRCWPRRDRRRHSWDAVDERLPVSRRDRVALSFAGTGTGRNDPTD